MAPSYLEKFCNAPQWDLDTEFGYSSLLGFTLCFQELVILGIIHFTYYGLCMYRAWKLYRQPALKQLIISNTKIQYVKIGLCFLNFLIPFGVLNVALFSGTETAGFLIASSLLTSLSWAMVTLVLWLELKCGYLGSGNWILPFLWIFSFVGRILKIRSIIILFQRSDRNYYTFTYFVELGATFLLVLLSIFAQTRTYRASARQQLDLSEDELPVLGEDFPIPDEEEQVGLGQFGNVYPETKANWLSRLVFWWTNGLVALGYHRTLQMEDMWDLPKKDSGPELVEHFSREWGKEFGSRKQDASLFRALWQCHGKQFMLAGLYKVVNDASQFVGPTLLGSLIAFTKDDSIPAGMGYLYVLLIFAGAMIGAIGEQWYFHTCVQVGLRVRGSLITAVYRKSLLLTAKERQGRSTGQILNHMASDTEQLQQVLTNLHVLWSSPTRIIVAIVLLCVQLGPSALAGVVTLGLMIPIQTKIVKMSGELRKSALLATDERLKVVNEILEGIKVIKYYAWENSFLSKVLDVRGTEWTWLKKASYLNAGNNLLINLNPILVTIVSFTIFVASGNQLTPSIAFTALSLFNVLRIPLIFFPQIVTQAVNARVSLQRLNSFLAADELVEHPPRPDTQFAVTVAGASFTWGKGIALRDVNLKIPHGQFVCVLGRTGSGKSTLLSAILGEAERLHGSVNVTGSLAYVSQEAWIFNGTVRDNILFGRPFIQTKYERAIRLASLTRDLKLFSGGDQHELGEKGVNVSGGQKQRINIARAIYADADVYIFDDPLSALDASVGRSIFQNLMCDALKGKTRILVTNQIQFVGASDLILMMEDGKIGETGSYSQLMEKRGLFAALMNEQGGNDTGEESLISLEPEILGKQEGEDLNINNFDENNENNNNESDNNDNSLGQERETTKEAIKPSSKLMSEEERAEGAVKWEIYMKYIRAAGGSKFLGVVLPVFMLIEASRIWLSWWLSQWSAGTFDLRTAVYISVYAGGSIVQSALTIAISLSFAIGGLAAAGNLHNGLFNKILLAPMSFFDSTPVGRILNRFSKDQSAVDTLLAPSLQTFASGVFQLLSTLLVIAVITPYSLIAFVPVFCAFYFVQLYFRSTARELKRLDALSRSPIYANFSETLSGLGTIRAYRAQDHMSKINMANLDRSQSTILASFCANRWLSLRVEFLGGIVVLAAGLFAVLSRGTVSSEIIGLMLTYAFSVSALLNLIVRLFTEAEKNFNAVERILHYTENAPSEAAHVIPERRPDPSWPLEGKIEFQNVTMSYRPELPPVLKNANFSMRSMEKVGVCGRTGAGKSTLFQTLFRLVEVSSGSITIDDVDIRNYGLEDVRKTIGIIPQDPVLFTGSLRFNLDPFSEFSNDQVWDAISKAHLKDLVQSLPDTIDTLVSERGENFSVGQRQLLCLARALLRNPKILVLDEATASVDIHTDNLIQATIRNEFKNCTTLTIAHRLNTIIDSNRILVLDSGEIREFDTPANLLSKSGIFANLVKETGPRTSEFLRKIVFGEINYSEEIQSEANKAIDFIQKEKEETLESLEKKTNIRDRVHESAQVLREIIEGLNSPELKKELLHDNLSYDSLRQEIRQLVAELNSLMKTQDSSEIKYQ